MPGSGLRLTRFDSGDAFADRAFPFLLDREPEHNLIVGICGQLREGRYSDPYLAVVEDNDRVVAVAVRTPPHNVLLSHIDDVRALETIARDVHDCFGDGVPGVQGGSDDARRFAGIWTTLTMKRAVTDMQQRIYQATRVALPKGVPGEVRPATGDDRGLLIDWHTAFNEEALGRTPHDGVEANVDWRLAPATSSGVFIWWDGDPVAMVGFGRPTPNGIAVAPVFTPPDLRGRGYASACTAEVTKRLLDGGKRFVFLYTDLSNPTSNSIYQKIGYRPVCDVDQYRFE
jgi:uncharacterized protein